MLKMQVGITKGETFPLVVAVRKLELKDEKLKIQTKQMGITKVIHASCPQCGKIGIKS